MSAFAFETITETQAAAYSGEADALEFQTPGLSAALASVAYIAGSPEMVAITVAGRTVMFGAGVEGDPDIRFADGSQLYIGTTAAEAVTGTALPDALFGGQGTDSLVGGAGGDFLQGNQGGDSLVAQDGDDFVYGGQGDDAIDVGAGANFGQGNLGNDTVVAAAASGANLLLGGQGDDVVRGGDAGDFLNGNLGADFLVGGGGGDTLAGEGGADTLEGDSGVNVYLMGAGSSAPTRAEADRILGWSSDDRIDVPGSGGQSAFYMIPASGGGGGGGYGYEGPPMPQAMTFEEALTRANSWIRDHPAEVIVTAQVEDGVGVFVDTNGDRAADLAIILAGRSIFDVTGANFI